MAGLQVGISLPLPPQLPDTAAWVQRAGAPATAPGHAGIGAAEGERHQQLQQQQARAFQAEQQQWRWQMQEQRQHQLQQQDGQRHRQPGVAGAPHPAAAEHSSLQVWADGAAGAQHTASVGSPLDAPSSPASASASASASAPATASGQAGAAAGEGASDVRPARPVSGRLQALAALKQRALQHHQEQLRCSYQPPATAPASAPRGSPGGSSSGGGGAQRSSWGGVREEGGRSPGARNVRSADGGGQQRSVSPQRTGSPQRPEWGRRQVPGSQASSMEQQQQQRRRSSSGSPGRGSGIGSHGSPPRQQQYQQEQQQEHFGARPGSAGAAGRLSANGG